MLKKIKEYWDFLKTHFSVSSNRKILSIITLVAIAIALPAVVILAQNQQTYRQRASELVSPPFPGSNSIVWQTEHASLKADDFYIIANGKKFLANTGNLNLHSAPPYAPNFDSTTLEATWNENNVEMRMYMYFKKQNGKWSIYEIRTYNGKESVRSDWIYYDGFAGGNIGSEYDNATLDLNSKQHPYAPNNTDKGSIHFSNIHLQPFLLQIPKTGYYIYKGTSTITTTTPLPNSSTYVIRATLFKDGDILKDLTGLNYVWSIADNTVATIRPFSESSDCQTLGQSPCPQQRLEITRLKQGNTTIKLDIKNSAQALIATATYNLIVNAASSTTPTPTPVGKASPCGNYGDVSGDGYVTSADAILISNFQVGNVVLTDVQKTRADVKVDGTVDMADALFIAQYAAGTRATFPVCDTIPTPTLTSTPAPVSACIPGDIDMDGKITMIDTNFVLKYLAGSTTLTDDQKKRADVNGDGKITVVDALFIGQHVAGSRKTFPVPGCK